MTFVPPAGLGPFQFPSPWNSQGIRLTNQNNAPQGCEPRLYSYWSCVNNHRGYRYLYVVLGRIGMRPILLSVHKDTGDVATVLELGEGTAEGWYFSDTRPLDIYMIDGAGLFRYDLFDGRTETVFTLDPQYGDDLWQAHSSADDTVHSATVRWRTSDGPYEVLGAVVFRNGRQTFFPKQGNFDECIVDKSGRWLVIQENNDNRIVDLRAGATRVIRDRDGAVAHCDVGDGILVGEDDSGDNWRMRLWDLETGSTRVLLEGTPPWGNGLGHLAISGGRALLSSNATGELIDVSLGDGSSRAIAPGMLAVAPGMNQDELYDRQLRACWDSLGEYACYISNTGDPYGRFDAFLVPVGESGPIIVRPPDPKPPTPGGPMTYEAMGGDAAGQRIGQALFADYAEAGQAPDDGMAIWFWRTAFDALSMSVDASIRKHQREWRTVLGLTGGPGNPQ